MRCILKRHKERYACACPSAALEVGTWFSFSPSWALVKDCGRILTSSLLLWYSYFFVNKCQWNRKNWNSEKGIMTEVISRWWQSWWYRSPYIYHKPGHSNAFLKTTSAAYLVTIAMDLGHNFHELAFWTRLSYTVVPCPCQLSTLAQVRVDCWRPGDSLLEW